jgi:DNA polymerase III delta subunit
MKETVVMAGTEVRRFRPVVEKGDRRIVKCDHMSKIILAFGQKETFLEDVHYLATRWFETPRVVVTTGASAVVTVSEKVSGLFVEDNLVLVLLDPPSDTIEQVAPALKSLQESAGIIIYSTSTTLELPPSLEAERVNIEKEKEERVKAKVLSAVRAEGKKMTDKAYALLKERIRDEAFLKEELAKLVAYTGEKKVIEVKDVAAVITDTQEESFIGLSDALAKKKGKRVIAILDTLLSQGFNILAVHGFLSKYVSLLIQARDKGESLRAAPDFRAFSKGFSRFKDDLEWMPTEKKNFLAYQKPYYAYSLCKTSQVFSDETLELLLGMLVRLDKAIKSGTKHERTAFEAGLLDL